MNPFPASTAKNNPTLNELSRLGISTPNPSASIKLRGKASPLSQIERQQIAEGEGKLFYQRASKLISSPSWPRRPDDAKRSALSDLRRDIDDGRAARLAKLRKAAQAELARASL